MLPVASASQIARRYKVQEAHTGSSPAWMVASILLRSAARAATSARLSGLPTGILGNRARFNLSRR